MPDAYGFETPAEVSARIRDRFSKRATQVAATGGQAGNKYVRTGAALGGLWSGVAKRIDETHGARRAEQARLQEEEGLSAKEAKKKAKENVSGYKFDEERKADKFERLKKESMAFASNPAAIAKHGQVGAQAIAMTNFSTYLREQGMYDEANAMALKAKDMIDAEEARVLAVKEVKADIAHTEASTAELDSNRTDPSNISTVAGRVEVLTAELETTDPDKILTQAQRDAKLYERGSLQAWILNETTKVGRTENDPDAVFQFDKIGLRDNIKELANDTMMMSQLDFATEMIGNTSAWERSYVSKARKGWIGYMEKAFGREPTESEQDFIDRVTAAEAAPTLVAAQVRHALTGAQMSAFEIVYLEPFLPGPNDSPTIQQSKINAFAAYTSMNVETRISMLEAHAAGESVLKDFFAVNRSQGSASLYGPRKPTTDGDGTLTATDPQGNTYTIGTPTSEPR